MIWIRFFTAAVIAGVCAPMVFADTPSPSDQDKAIPTHEKVAEVSLKGAGGLALQTLCADKDGRILGLVAQTRYFSAQGKKVTSEVHVLSADGKKVTEWKVDFHAHSLNVSPDGTVFVAGDGKVERFNPEGKSLGQIELPHIAEMVKNKDALRTGAEQQLKQQRESFEQARKTFAAQKEKLEKKKPEELTDQEKKQLEQYRAILKSYDQTAEYYAKKTVDEVVAETLNRLRIINGIAVSSKDVFLVCGETKGYGYAIWRMTHDFKEPKQVKSGVVGCCGQMDVQVAGTDFLLAENTKYKFARYDRDGKSLGEWGKGKMVEAGKEPPCDCFGGCCNPMNLRVDKSGDIYTAESEGIIKRFSAKGEFLGTVAKVSLTGGCKNVAVAVSGDAEKVYFCDQPGSKVLILAKKKPTRTTGGN